MTTTMLGLVNASLLSPVELAALMGGVAALLTSLGGVLVLFLGPRRIGTDLLIDLGLGFSSGVMIVASFTSLLLPAIERSGPVLPVAGLVVGATSIHLLNDLVPHEHLVKGYEGPSELRNKLRTAWLVAMAIIIHNIPEGIAIGATSAYSPELAVATGLAIGIQDIPEGLAVALPVYASTGRRLPAVGLAVLSGVSELLVAVPSAVLAGLSSLVLPFAMGFGAGAMVYVVSHESIPETHRSGHEDKATLAFFAGFILMLLLDTMLG
ncbi:MAG: ZIP family metal transporter [Desulfurococcales archaeon]|nr:ZIP family metal transporter [Desulfurococcales archaeon]